MSAGRGFRLRYVITSTEHRTPPRRLINFLCNLTSAKTAKIMQRPIETFPAFSSLLRTCSFFLPPPSFHQTWRGSYARYDVAWNFLGDLIFFYILHSGCLYVKVFDRTFDSSDLIVRLNGNWSKVKVDGMLEKVFQAFEDRSIIEDDIKSGLSRTNVHACCNDFTLRWRRVFNKVDWKILSVCRFG